MNAAERTEIRRAWSESAGLILAAARGEDTPHELLKALATSGDLAGALTLLHCAIVTAGDAIRADVEASGSAPPSLDHLAAVMRHAARVEAGEVEL